MLRNTIMALYANGQWSLEQTDFKIKQGGWQRTRWVRNGKGNAEGSWEEELWDVAAEVAPMLPRIRVTIINSRHSILIFSHCTRSVWQQKNCFWGENATTNMSLMCLLSKMSVLYIKLSVLSALSEAQAKATTHVVMYPRPWTCYNTILRTQPFQQQEQTVFSKNPPSLVLPFDRPMFLPPLPNPFSERKNPCEFPLKNPVS